MGLILCACKSKASYRQLVFRHWEDHMNKKTEKSSYDTPLRIGYFISAFHLSLVSRQIWNNEKCSVLKRCTFLCGGEVFLVTSWPWWNQLVLIKRKIAPIELASYRTNCMHVKQVFTSDIRKNEWRNTQQKIPRDITTRVISCANMIIVERTCLEHINWHFNTCDSMC